MTITVKCVYCGNTKTVSGEEAKQMPFCEKDYGPMIAVEAKTN